MQVDERMQSLSNYGTPDFPFSFYQDESELPDHRNISWHWHNSLEFSYVSKGTVCCEIGGKKIRLEQGDGIFINSGILHCFMLQEASVLKNIFFEPEFLAPSDSRMYLNSVLPYLQSGLQYSVFRAENERENQLISQIKKCCVNLETENAENPNRYFELFSDVVMLWRGFVEHCKAETVVSAKPGWSFTQNRVRKMLQYIYYHYGEKIGLAEIAAAANVSQREALRCFSEFIGISPVQYLNGYRLKCAEQLLRKTAKTISDIALETGYDNPGYFCKVFKKNYGLSPLQYRKAEVFSVVI